MSAADRAMMIDGFAPFVPRVVTRRTRPTVESREPEDTPAPDAAPAAEAAQASSSTSVPEPSDEPAISIPEERTESIQRGPHACEGRCAASLRELAIKLAGEACARALHVAIARNPLFVARFVDDALEAAGRAACTLVRLSPAAAAACDGRLAVGVLADGRVADGEVVVESSGGTVGATIEQRSRLLVRAATDP